MRYRPFAMLIGVLLVPVAANTQDKKDSLVRALPVAGLVIAPRTDGKATKPTAIKSAEDLAKAIPNAESQAVIKKGVDLDKEQIVQFHWFGPKADKLAFSVTEGKKEVVFRFTPGEKTKDLHEQFHLFVLPRDATWKVESVR